MMDKKIQKTIEQYSGLCDWLSYNRPDFLEIKPSEYNRKDNRQTELYMRLFNMGRPGIQALYELLDRGTPATKMMTALYLIARFTDKCLATLESLKHIPNPDNNRGIAYVIWAADHWIKGWHQYGYGLYDIDPLWEKYKDEDFSDFE